MAVDSPSFKPKSGRKHEEHLRFGEMATSYLFADSAELIRFMQASGYDADSLRAALGSAELALAVMDYFAANEAALLAMCANVSLDVKEFMACWRRLNHTI